MTDTRIEHARSVMMKGFKLFKQLSQSRRIPAREAIPFLECARAEFEKLSSEESTRREALEYLAMTQAALLDYGAAIVSIQKLLAFQKSKLFLKRLAHYQEEERFWRTIGLSPQQLTDLEAHLAECFGQHGPKGSTKFGYTLEWLANNAPELNAEQIIENFREQGAFDDWQVFSNVVR